MIVILHFGLRSDLFLQDYFYPILPERQIQMERLLRVAGTVPVLMVSGVLEPDTYIMRAKPVDESICLNQSLTKGILPNPPGITMRVTLDVYVRRSFGHSIRCSQVRVQDGREYEARRLKLAWT